VISIDALVLQASRDLAPADVRNEAHLNSVLAGAAHKLGFFITEDTAAEALLKLKKVVRKKH
jgi:hypothetical protein